MRCGGWFWAVVLALVGIVAVACRSGSDGPGDASAGGPVLGGPGEVSRVPSGHVVAGDEAGWVVDPGGRVWRIDLDGTVARTDAEVPRFNGGFTTFFAGRVVFAGTRCDGSVEGEACDGESVVELRLLDEDDQSVETIELFRAPGSRYRSVGVGTYGATGDQLWVYRDIGEILLVDPDGEITETDIASGPGTPAKCLIGRELYGLDDISAPPVDDPTGPALTVLEPGHTPAEERWTVSRWDGQAWSPVAGGVYSRSGEEATIGCQAQGFVVESYGDQTPYQVWTPRTGWRPPEPSTAALDRSALLVSSTNNAYLVEGATVHRVDLAEGLTATPLDAEQLGGEPTAASIQAIDDAGRLLVACGGQTEALHQCVVTRDH